MTEASPQEVQAPPRPDYKEERRLRKGDKSDITPTLPIHAPTLATFSNVSHITIQLPVVVTLAELSSKGHMIDLARRAVLYRNPAIFAKDNLVGGKRARNAESDSDDEGAQRRATHNAPRQMIVCIKSIGTPKSHVQSKGKSGSSIVKFMLPVDVIVATIGLGFCPGIIREQPIPEYFNVEVASGNERITVTCLCPEQENGVIGHTVLVAVEPTCLRLQVFRPPRPARGKFQKTIDVKLGKTEIIFQPDFEGDAQKRKAAEERAVATAPSE